MRVLRHLIFLSPVIFSACFFGLDPKKEGFFTCSTDDHCSSGFVCSGSVCVKPGGTGGDPGPDAECNKTSDCSVGWICQDRQCWKLCAGLGDCTELAGHICGGGGYCIPAAPGDPKGGGDDATAGDTGGAGSGDEGVANGDTTTPGDNDVNSGDTAPPGDPLVPGLEPGATLLVSTQTANAHSRNPVIASDGNYGLHMVWEDDCISLGVTFCPQSASGNTAPDIFYRSYNQGTLGPLMFITATPGGGAMDGHSREPAIAAIGNQIHIVWSESGDFDENGTDFDLVHVILEGGSIWAGPTLVTDGSSQDDVTPALATDGMGRLHLAWTRQTNPGLDEDIFYNRWTTGGGWETEILISTDAANSFSRSPAIATDATDSVHIVWQDNSTMLSSGIDWDIFYQKVTTGLLDGPTRLVTDDPADGDSTQPTITVFTGLSGTGDVHCAWRDDGNIGGSGADGDIWYRSFDASPGAYLAVGDPITSEEDSRDPAFVQDADNIYLFYAEELFGADPTEIWSTEWFVSEFMPPLPVAATLLASERPRGAPDGHGDIYVVWQDDTTISPDTEPDTDVLLGIYFDP